MYHPALRRAFRDRIVAVVIVLTLAVLFVFMILIERRNARLGIRTPSLFMPSEPSE